MGDPDCPERWYDFRVRDLALVRGKQLLPAAVEAMLVLAVYTAYSLLRVFVEGADGDAVDNALGIIAVEKSMGIFYELDVQRAFAAVPGLLVAMEGAYRFLYLPCIILGACAGYLRDRPLYQQYRSAFFMSLGIGLIFFTLLPVAPPRLLPEYGFVDVVHGVGLSDSDTGKNNFAAVPSFHFGFPLLMTVGFCHAFRLKPWQCAIAGLLPLVMLLAIVSTANHFFLDAAIGAGVVLFCAWWCVWRPRGLAMPARRLLTPAGR
jgi:hypothetical protein